MNNYTVLKFDGASRANPGHSGAAAFLYEISFEEDEVGTEEDEPENRSCAVSAINNVKVREVSNVIWYNSEYLGSNLTCNQAEYHGLLLGLEKAVSLCLSSLVIQGDSELVIKQMSGEYNVMDQKLIPLHQQACELVRQLPTQPIFEWIPRQQNEDADYFAGLVITRKLGEEDADMNDSIDDEEERNENYGFLQHELNTLLSYGMKPWNNYDECWQFIQAYNSGQTDSDGNPLWSQYLSSSTMWDD